MYNTVLDDNNIIYNEYTTEIHKILPKLLDEELNVFGITTVIPANLQRSKIWGLSILHYTPPPPHPRMSTAPTPSYSPIKPYKKS